MKNLLLLLCFSFFAQLSLAQDGENPLPYAMKEPVYDTAPRFPGGPGAMLKFFEDSIRYPEPERSKLIQGYVSVKFEVTKKGKVVNVKLVNGVPGGPNLAREALRIMHTMPLWIPATKKGKPVLAEYNISIPFKIKAH